MQTASTFTLIIIYVVLFVLELSNRDPAATYHTYESDSARVLVAVRIVLLIWFVWCVRRSAMNEEGPGVARFFKQFAVVGAVWLVSLPVYSLVATTIPSWHRLKTISALMSTTNFATLAAIGWLTLPSRAPTPPPPPGPPPPTDEGGPAAGTHRAAPSLDETSRRRGSGRAIVPTNPPAQQRRPSWGSNLGLVPGQCAPPTRPPAPVSAHRVTAATHSLSLHHSRQSSHPPFRPPAPTAPAPPLTTHARRPSRRRPHAKCAGAAGADARRQPVVGRTDVEHAAADTTAVGRRLRSQRRRGSARAGARSRRSSAHRLRHTAGGGRTAAGDAARCGRPRRAAQQPHARREDSRAVVFRARRGLDARRQLECT